MMPSGHKIGPNCKYAFQKIGSLQVITFTSPLIVEQNQKEQKHHKYHYLIGRHPQATKEHTPQQDTSRSSTTAQGAGITRKPANVEESAKYSVLPDVRDIT